MSNRIYRKIWESHNGPIPVDEDGRSYEIHHKDGNHANNDIKNLVCVSIKEHYDIHFTQGDYAACHLIAKRMAKTSDELSKIVSDLNKKRTGEKNPFYGKKHTKETKEILKEKNSGKNNYWYGKKRPETAKKISKSLKGRQKTKEHKRALAEAKIGKVYKQYSWKIKYNNDEFIIQNLKKWCKDNGISYRSFYGGKEHNGYKLIGRVQIEKEK